MSAMRAQKSIGSSLSKLALTLALTLTAGAAWADGKPSPKQIGMEEAATPIMQNVRSFHDHLLVPILTGIVVLVAVLLLVTMVRFNKKANPVPAKFSHNTLIEVIWTAIPIIILVVIAVPSFKLLYQQDVIPKADITVKAIGNQWYWSYEYPDNGGISFDSLMITDKASLADPTEYLLKTDNAMVVPAGKVVRVQVNGADVIHSWTVPSFGVKIDAIPGKLNETWFKVDKPGTYFGQCSELCGINHAFMPIEVKVVPQAEFDAWVASKQ